MKNIFIFPLACTIVATCLVCGLSPQNASAEELAPTIVSTTTPLGNVVIVRDQAGVREHKYVTRLHTQTRATTTLGYVELTWPVLALTTFSDIRLLNSNGEEIPYFLKRGDEQVGKLEEKVVEGELSNLIVRNGKTEFVVDLGGGVLPHNKITIDTKTPNFTRTVSLYGSDERLPLDDAKWGLVAENRYIYSYNDPKAGVYASSKTIAYPQTGFRYIKIVINRDKKQPSESVSVSGARATLKGVDNEKAILSSLQDNTNVVRSRLLEIKQNDAKKQTEVYVDLGSAGVAVSGATLKIEGTNFTRSVVVQGAFEMSSTTVWNTFGSGDIHKIDATLYQGSKLNITFAPKRYRYIRVVVKNNDSKPLDITGVDLVTRPDYLVFSNTERAEDKTFVDVYFGSQKVKAPTYDLSGELLYGTTEQFQLFTVGKVEQNPFLNPAQPQVPWSEKNKWAINTALVVLAIIIAGLVFVYIRKISVIKS